MKRELIYLIFAVGFLVVVGGGFIAVGNRAENAEAERDSYKATLEAMQPTATPVETATSTPMPQPTMTPPLMDLGYCQGKMLFNNSTLWDQNNGKFFASPYQFYEGQIVNVLDWQGLNYEDYVFIQTQTASGYVFYLEVDLTDCYPPTPVPTETITPYSCITPKSPEYRTMYDHFDKTGNQWMVTPGVVYGVYNTIGQMVNIYTLSGSNIWGWIDQSDINYVACPQN